MSGEAVQSTTRQIIEQTNRIGVQFLLADVAAALTFLDVASVTASEGNQRRNQQSALTAYQTVLRLLPKVSPSHEEQAVLKAKLEELRIRLIATGTLVDSEKGENDSVPDYDI